MTKSKGCPYNCEPRPIKQVPPSSGQTDLSLGMCRGFELVLAATPSRQQDDESLGPQTHVKNKT